MRKPITIGCIFWMFMFLMTFTAWADAGKKKEEILIGLIPEMNVFAQMERFKPLAEYLSQRTGIPVRLKILSRYGNIIDSFSSERMDGAFFGSFTGTMAIEKLGAVPIARPINIDGESTYHGLIYVRKDSGIETVSDMKGKKFAFVEKSTTAGYLFPLAWLRKQGITDLDSFFSEYYFAGSHDATLYAVLSGKADIGASKHSVYLWMKEKDPRIDKELKVLAQSPKVPSNGLFLRKDIDEETKKAFRKALLELDSSPHGQRVLKKFHALKFIETSVKDYLPVYRIVNDAGIDLKTYQYQNE